MLEGVLAGPVRAFVEGFMRYYVFCCVYAVLVGPRGLVGVRAVGGVLLLVVAALTVAKYDGRRRSGLIPRRMAMGVSCSF